MGIYKLLYLDPENAYVKRAQEYLASSRDDIDFYGETSITKGVQRLRESYFNLVITKPSFIGYLGLLQRIPSEQYGNIVIFSNKPQKYGYRDKKIIFQRSRPFEHNLSIVVNGLLPKVKKQQ